MNLTFKTPKQSLSKAFLKLRPLRNDINLFKNNLSRLLGKINEIEREENQKNHIRDFLRDTFYKDKNEINPKDDKDLVIHLGKTREDNVGVIMEAKRPSNKNEMLTAEKPNAKALHELILYYLHERNEENNNELKNLIVTNVYEWFIFDANHFDKHIYENGKIKKLYETYSNDKKDTTFFYEEVAKIIAKLETNIPCTHFDIRHYEKELKNADQEADKNLIALFKILSPYHLLKEKFSDDSNKLDDKFYKELLHIIGLEEVKEGSKFLIKRKSEPKRDAGSLLEMAIAVLETEDPLHKIADIENYGAEKEERIYNVAVELCITWINRILFLKLLEGQLINYHKGDEQYKFLNSKMIKDFDELYKLFHLVLARTMEDRPKNIKEKYKRVPYLNSSLFEISDLEDITLKVSQLDNSAELKLISTSVLRKEEKAEALPTLEYIFRFLNAYDFASEGTEDIQEDSKTLINASVLGKVFEKINGYKDGSVYTPGFITMYMCRQSIRQAVVQKFKEKYAWDVETFDDLKNYLADKKNSKDILIYNKLIRSLRICDPAVGSGHFLVSALNELIAIKYELGILADDKGARITEYEITIENDEIIVTNHEGDIFEYTVIPDKTGESFKIKPEVQRLQRTLFHEKQTIIENCLFGVDINPNSVKICRLRLWIELLKNAYYKEDGELETLPNIDINIKCGNSLISRFPLDADLSKALKSIKYSIDQYKGFVDDYKKTKDRETKKGIEKIISSIKADFKTNIYKNDPLFKKLHKLQYEFNLLVAPNIFKEPDEAYGNKENKKKAKERIAGLETQIIELNQQIEEIKNNSLYRNAFEWRFEFPEILDSDGSFVGFDVVIGNPPYIDIKSLPPGLVKILFNIFKTTENRINLYSVFIELGLNILKPKGIFSYINPNSILMNSSYSKLRKFIYPNVKEIIKLSDDVFSESEVIVETIIIFMQKSVEFKDVDVIRYKHNDKLVAIDNGLLTKQSKEIWSSFNDFKFNIYLSNEMQKVLLKVRNETKPLCELVDFSLGITPYDKYKGHSEKLIKNREYHSEKKISKVYQPLIAGENIGRYFINNDVKEYIKYGDWLGAPREERFFVQPRIIVRQIISGNPPRIYAGYTEEALYFTQIGFGIIPKGNKISGKYLVALLNSKLFTFMHKYLYLDVEKELFQKILIENCKQFPIKEINIKEQKPFISLVDKILVAKEKGKDTTALEAEIDKLVYELYELTPEEIKIVEGN